jgi:diaminohydroxyphosphoribosylaminopyrimidine deaminase/5-amino-6-(5-phosphoribosylamino)uracil reductase
MALNQVKNTALLPQSTLYVSLEPCSHYGKTPPCVDRIIASGIKQVVIGILDPNPQVAGMGIEKLIASACSVQIGVLDREIRKALRFFLSTQERKRPYVILKWAESGDGLLAPLADQRTEQAPVWISNTAARQRVHQWRTEVQAILVGWKTAAQDAAQLTARDWDGDSPHRILIDPSLQTPLDSPIFNDHAPTTVFLNDSSRAKKLIEAYSYIQIVEIRHGEHSLLSQVMDYLYQNQCNSLMVEGGAASLHGFIEEDLWDEMWVVQGPVLLEKGIAAPNRKGILYSTEDLQDNRVDYYHHPTNPYFI